MLELGHFPTKNSFRPKIILSWQQIDGSTHIHAIYRLSLYLLLPSALLFIMGIYISIQQSMLIPFVVNSILAILIFGIFRLLSQKSISQVRDKLNGIIANQL